MAEIKNIPVEKIKVGDHALRLEPEDEAIDELAASIRRIGIIVPLVVSLEGDSFLLIAGHRRLAAAKRICLSEVPCIVREAKVAAGVEVSFAENLFRLDLSPVELAAGIKDVLTKDIMDVQALAKVMHRSAHWVNAQVSLLSWPEDVLAAIHSGWLSVSAASNLALITDGLYREFLLRNAADSGATARTTAAWLQAFRAMQPPEAAITAKAVSGESRSTPMVPQAPCLGCGQVHRSDELSHVPMCSQCIQAVREALMRR
ncbi:Nucleoid occlusion protein [subsurface metagenome]